MADPEKLSDLLARLENQASEGLARQTFRGHALGKTEDSLHLAVPSGVIAIPFAEIESVTRIFGRGPDWISVVVRDVDKVTRIRRVRPFFPALVGFSVLPIPWLGADCTCTDHCTDTSTITNSGEDATDDAYCEPSTDDVPDPA